MSDSSYDINFLQRKNPHERDDRILFEEANHAYTIDDDADYTSVTTWIHTHFAAFDADSVIANMRKSWKWGPDHKYFGMTDDEIKKAWDDNRDAAAAAGTAMHFNIECFYNGHEVSDDSIEFTYFRNFVSELPNLTPYRTEWKIFHEDLRIAGSVDMLFQKADGSFAIYDWKRSREISKNGFNKFATTPCIKHIPDSNHWHYCLQLNMYKAILEAKYDIKVSEMKIVCLHPNNKNGNYQCIEIADLSDEVASLFRMRNQEIS